MTGMACGCNRLSRGRGRTITGPWRKNVSTVGGRVQGFPPRFSQGSFRRSEAESSERNGLGEAELLNLATCGNLEPG